MRRIIFVFVALLAMPVLSPWLNSISSDEPVLSGFSAESSRAERQWEEKFKAIPSPQLMRDYMQRLSARPHNVGTPYDKDNAEWLAAKFKEFGLDTHIETFDILYPTPKERVGGVGGGRTEVRGEIAGATSAAAIRLRISRASSCRRITRIRSTAM